MSEHSLSACACHPTPTQPCCSPCHPGSGPPHLEAPRGQPLTRRSRWGAGKRVGKDHCCPKVQSPPGSLFLILQVRFRASVCSDSQMLSFIRHLFTEHLWGARSYWGPRPYPMRLSVLGEGNDKSGNRGISQRAQYCSFICSFLH